MNITMLRIASIGCLLLWLLGGATATAQPESSSPAVERPRARDLGIELGILPPGALNAITDVDGVAVGHYTLRQGVGTRTGVTAVLPHRGNLFQDKVAAGVYVANAFGKAAGLLQVQELGNLETPIVLTNTLDVGIGLEAVVGWSLSQPGNETVGSVNAVVGETNDGFLNEIRRQALTQEMFVQAIESAASSLPAEGSIGAGTGTIAFGFKGGIGTASRRLPASLGGYTVGVLLQSNFGGVLTIDGIRVGEALGRFAFRRQLLAAESPEGAQSEVGEDDGDEGSCMIVIATDAPLSARNLERLARRAPLGLARTGSFISNGSGDFVIAFSTTHRVGRASTPPTHLLQNEAMSPLFLAVVEATEEAVVNSLLQATSMTGQQGRSVEALPIDRLRALIAERNRD